MSLHQPIQIRDYQSISIIHTSLNDQRMHNGCLQYCRKQSLVRTYKEIIILQDTADNLGKQIE